MSNEIRPKVWYDYMKWLAKKIRFNKKSYYNLLKKLHDTDFTWADDCEMDKSRAGDGIYQRYYFFRDLGLSSDSDFPYECSVFEMLAGFAIRMCDNYLGYASDGSSGYEVVFELFLKNLGLEPEIPKELIDEKLIFWMGREYKNDGIGSIFNLPRRVNGFNKTEIWKQMNIFLTENEVENVSDLERFL